MPKCAPSVRGDACDFHEAAFNTTTAIFWFLTALPLVAWAMPCLRKQWAASSIARASLLLAAASSIMCCTDDVLTVTVGRHASASLFGEEDNGYGNKTLMAFGSIFLVLGVTAFSHVWCDVAVSLEKLYVPGGKSDRMVAAIRHGYKSVALVHVPFAVMFAFHDYNFMVQAISYETVSTIWFGWVIFGTCFALSGLALLQYGTSVLCLNTVPGALSLKRTALINLVQQVLFDIGIIVYGVLYKISNEDDGGIIAAYSSVYFVTYWAMHVQVVVFFSVLGPTDPLYSQIELDALLLKAQDHKDEAPPSAGGAPVTTVGVAQMGAEAETV